MPNEEGYVDYFYSAEFAKKIPWKRRGHRFVTGEDILLDPKMANALGYVNTDYAYLWLYNPAYTFTYRTDRPAGNTELTLQLKNGNYSISRYNTENGEFSMPEIYEVTDGSLTVYVPEFRRDIALCVERVEKC